MALVGYEYIKRESRFCWLFAWFLNSLMITDSFRVINEIWLNLPLNYVDYFRNSIYIVIFIVFIYYFYRFNELNLLKLSIIAFLYIFLALLSNVVTPGILPGLLSATLIFFSRCIPGFYFAQTTKNFSFLFKILQKFVFFNMAYSLVPFLSNVRQDYNMSMSYNFLIPAIVAIFSVIIEKKYLYIIPFLLYVSTIILYGSRGALVCLMVVVLLYIYDQAKKVSMKYKVMSLLVLSFLLVIIFGFYKEIISMLDILYPNSRTLYILNNTSIFDLTGRDVLYKSALQLIYESPFAFRGILSDRYLLGKAVFDTNDWLGCYAHNLILELAINFGIIITFMIIVFLLLILIKTLKQLKNSSDRYSIVFVGLAIAFVFVRSMFSGGYITDYAFFMGLGFLMNSYTRK